MPDVDHEGRNPVSTMKNYEITPMKVCGILLFLLYLLGCKSASEENSDSINVNNYLFVDVFGCAFPIPNKYILISEAPNITYFVNDFGSTLSEEDYLGRITISSYTPPDFTPSDSIPDFYRKLIYSKDGLNLYALTSDKFVAFSLNNGIQMTYFYKGGINERKIISMIDYCIEHRTE
jgi:hypothetical protein